MSNPANELHQQYDYAALESLLHDATRRSTRASRWQFKLFVLGGVCFVVWRLTDMLGPSVSAVRQAEQPTHARQALYVVGAGVVPASAAVRSSVDADGRDAVCISGWAYDLTSSDAVKLKARYAAPRPDGLSVPQRRYPESCV